MKKCGKCQVSKIENEFNRNRSTKDGFQDYCKECQKQAKKKWSDKYPGRVAELSRMQREKNPEKSREASKRWSHENPDKVKANMLRKRYGITLDQWNEMFAKQEGRCLVCGAHQDETTHELAVDHDHKTNKVRGLLCCRCNRAIGLLNDDAALLRKAASYLEEDQSMKSLPPAS